jgi:hypothetical protein
VLGSDWLNNIITTAIEIKENTAKVNFSELFTGSKNVNTLAKDNAAAGTRKLHSTFVYDPFRTTILCR